MQHSHFLAVQLWANLLALHLSPNPIEASKCVNSCEVPRITPGQQAVNAGSPQLAHTCSSTLSFIKPALRKESDVAFIDLILNLFLSPV